MCKSSVDFLIIFFSFSSDFISTLWIFKLCATISKIVLLYKYLDSFIKDDITVPGNFKTAALRYFGSSISLPTLSLKYFNRNDSSLLTNGEQMNHANHTKNLYLWSELNIFF